MHTGVGMDDERITRVTLPTASFSLTPSLIAWIAEEAKRRSVKKSVLVREILSAARQAEPDEREALAS